MKIFDSIAKFFDTVANLVNIEIMCLIVFGMMLLLLIVTFIRCRCSYEARLIKALDKLISYMSNHPQIDETNLVEFNKKMKKVPHVLRKQWQQFMLYREHNASYYMSFQHVVENPMRTSTYKQQIKVFNIVSYILAFLSLIITANTLMTANASEVFSQVFVLPFIVMGVNWIFTLFFNARLNAITADLFQNYQYFEIAIDKATSTLPEYVDYEVLFTTKEIKQGIPILFEYLEKRSIVEQTEMERARQRQIEHDRYNFDRTGLDSSLVLDRSVREAEIYLSNRNRLNQEIDQINSEINNIENNYKEKNKDYQRKLQASKENIERLKSQLEQAASNIEANYIKKQQQDELSRQLTLEKDFDTVTATRKKDLAALQAEIDKKNQEIDKFRTSLENAMVGEFETYTRKIYDKVEGIFNKEKNETAGEMQKLQSELKAKNEALAELEGNGGQAQVIAQLTEQKNLLENVIIEKNKYIDSLLANAQTIASAVAEPVVAPEPEYIAEPVAEPVVETVPEPVVEETEPIVEPVVEEPIVVAEEPVEEEIKPFWEMPAENVVAQPEEIAEPEPVAEPAEEPADEEPTDGEPADEGILIELPEEVEPIEETAEIAEKPAEEPKKHPGRPRKVVEEAPATEKRGRGRPRKEETKDEPADAEPKKSPGRPKKETTDEPATEKRGRGRPKKTETDLDSTEPAGEKRGRGRPRKEETKEETTDAEPKKGPGRPKKETTDEPATEKRGRGRPKKTETALDSAEPAGEKRGRGRPRKEDTIDDKLNDLNKTLEESRQNLMKVQEQLKMQDKKDE